MAAPRAALSALSRTSQAAPLVPRLLATLSRGHQQAVAAAPAAQQETMASGTFELWPSSMGEPGISLDLSMPDTELAALKTQLRQGELVMHARLQVQGQHVHATGLTLQDPAAAQRSMPAASNGADWKLLPAESRWQDMFSHLHDWIDQRASKQGRQPDFKCRVNRDRALWLDSRDLPSWVPQQVEEAFGEPQPGAPINGGEFEALLAGGPNAWYDNRVDKRNPRAPDFKHKTDDIAVWLASQDGTPKADAATLQRIEEVFGQPRAQPMGQAMPQQYGGQVPQQQQQYGGYPPQPQYSQPEQQASYTAAPAYSPRGQQGQPPAPATPQQQSPGYSSREEEAANKWQAYFADPGAYFDNRATKTKPNQPDFKAKGDSNNALWLNGAPDWVPQQLAQNDAAVAGA